MICENKKLLNLFTAPLTTEIQIRFAFNWQNYQFSTGKTPHRKTAPPPQTFEYMQIWPKNQSQFR